MKLIGSLNSPYVRKVRIVMAEKKLDYQFVEEDVWGSNAILASNPLGKVPCLVMEGGEAVFDSRVIDYATEKGSVAAPTAGLHFTRPLLERLRAVGVEIHRVTLHVGAGTFRPIRAAEVEQHRLEPEAAVVPAATAEAVNRARAQGRRVIAVGTTTTRTLEWAADETGRVRASRGGADLFIYPGYRFRVVDALVTNFHLPRSTLLLLVSAFAGRDRVLDAYRDAVALGYRFYSYGDAMLIL
jgi:S-adenosylmethionine:tRNA ribosyltransferase-isomerase